MPRYTKIITTCDRCNALIEEGDMQKAGITMWLRFQSFNYDQKFMDGSATRFLCKDCEKEFVDWFMNGHK